MKDVSCQVTSSSVVEIAQLGIEMGSISLVSVEAILHHCNNKIYNYNLFINYIIQFI